MVIAFRECWLDHILDDPIYTESAPPPPPSSPFPLWLNNDFKKWPPAIYLWLLIVKVVSILILSLRQQLETTPSLLICSHFCPWPIANQGEAAKQCLGEIHQLKERYKRENGELKEVRQNVQQVQEQIRQAKEVRDFLAVVSIVAIHFDIGGSLMLRWLCLALRLACERPPVIGIGHRNS